MSVKVGLKLTLRFELSYKNNVAGWNLGSGIILCAINYDYHAHAVKNKLLKC